MTMADVFRKSALERLASPEQLDKAITVSRPASWLALLGVTIIIVAAVVWSLLGTLPTTLPAHGITVNSGNANGQIVECYMPYADSRQIETGMKAVVYSTLDNTRYDAQVVDISFDAAELSDIELIFGASDIIVLVSLQIADGSLPERTLVTANIITQEVAPINLLFKT